MEIRQLLSRLEQKKALQKKLKLEHVTALETIDAQIRELHEKRARMVIRNREATEALQREIVEIAREVKRVHTAQAAQKEAAATPAPVENPTPVPAAEPVEKNTAPASGSLPQPAAATREGPPRQESADEAVTAILELLKSRGEMSESLLREKLRAKRVNVAELSKRLDKLVNTGVIRRRASNYSLAKKR